MIYKVYQRTPPVFVPVISPVDTPNFKHVANVTADNEEHAFSIMNRWDEPDLVERLTNHVRSLSVGDVLVDENNRGRMVATIGYEDVSPLVVTLLEA